MSSPQLAISSLCWEIFLWTGWILKADLQKSQTTNKRDVPIVFLSWFASFNIDYLPILEVWMLRPKPWHKPLQSWVTVLFSILWCLRWKIALCSQLWSTFNGNCCDTKLWFDCTSCKLWQQDGGRERKKTSEKRWAPLEHKDCVFH